MRGIAQGKVLVGAMTLLVCLFIGGRGVYADLTIVAEGRPRAVILIPDDPSPVVCEAADELARVIEKASGARLLIYPESEYWDRHPGWPASFATRLVVGNCAIVQESGINLTELPPEGFVIKTVGNHVILAGRDEPSVGWSTRGQRLPASTRGTWHAVCAFLEDYLRVRWLWPGPLGEVIPPTDNIAVGDIDRTDAPALVSRILRPHCFYGSGWHNAALELGLTNQEQFAMSQELDRWSDHQRLGASINIASTEFSKEWLEEFGDEHPEWFALQPSGRRLLSFGGGYKVRMCLSNPGVIDEVVRRIVAYVDEHPDIDGYGIAPSDVFGSYCVCDKCTAWGPTTSDLVARHAAAVAEKVKALRPGKLVHALAYHKYDAPPQSEVILPDNVVLSYVGIWYFGYLCDEVHQRSVEYWDGWAEICSKMVWRPNNFCMFTGVPKVYVTKLADDFRHFYNNKMIGVDFDRLGPNWANDGLNYYVTARLCWNPETPVAQIVDDYCEKGFGAAAAAVREYFAELEEITEQVAAARPTDDDVREIPAYYTADQLSTLRAILDHAAQTAADPVVTERIAFLSQGLEFAEIESPLFCAVQQTGEKKPSEAEIAQFRELLERRQQFARDHYDSWAVDVVGVYGRNQSWLEEQLFVEPKAGIFDDLANAYDEVMQLPEEWEFQLDPQLVGENEQWFAVDYDDSDWKPIIVGDFWENQGYEDYDSAAWYRRRVELPADLADKQVELCFGGADEVAHVWVNGILAGGHDIGPEGWDKRFIIDITHQVKPGEENLIAVRVIDSNRMGGLWQPIKVVTPKSSLIPIKDVWLRSTSPDAAYGRSNTLAVGAHDLFRSVLAWQLPENLDKVTIGAARLVLPLRYHTGDASYALYRFTEDFYEPKVNWNTIDGTTPWAGEGGAGGAIAGEPVARADLAAVSAEDVERSATPPALVFDVTELLRSWAGEEPPYGVLIVQDPPREGVTLSPHSREADDLALRPRLEIDYALAP